MLRIDEKEKSPPPLFQERHRMGKVMIKKKRVKKFWKHHFFLTEFPFFISNIESIKWYTRSIWHPRKSKKQLFNLKVTKERDRVRMSMKMSEMEKLNLLYITKGKKRG